MSQKSQINVLVNVIKLLHIRTVYDTTEQCYW